VVTKTELFAPTIISPLPPVAVIASSVPEDDEMQENTPISDRFRRVVWQAGQKKTGDVLLLLIPVTKFLRLLLKRERPAGIISKLELDGVNLKL
jgi:hypothetical protein